MAWSPDGTRLAAGGVDGAVRLWDVSPEPRVSLTIHHSVPTVRPFPVPARSGDGSGGATGGRPFCVRVQTSKVGNRTQNHTTNRRRACGRPRRCCRRRCRRPRPRLRGYLSRASP
ncbi:MAG: WD40 domain-containing protein [Actinomycetota bacterium]|nr:WD40 domain-containing protein [Actinomycetota bacterium]